MLIKVIELIKAVNKLLSCSVEEMPYECRGLRIGRLPDSADFTFAVSRFTTSEA
jgi:hypothetical protein